MKRRKLSPKTADRIFFLLFAAALMLFAGYESHRISQDEMVYAPACDHLQGADLPLPLQALHNR